MALDPLQCLTAAEVARAHPLAQLLPTATRRHALRERGRVLEGGAPGDRDEHVNAVGAARLRVGAQLELLERLADEVRDPDRPREAVARRRRVGGEDGGV